MSWLNGVLKSKRPNPREGMRIDCRPQGIEVASGEITKVIDSSTVMVRVSWSTTSMFGINMTYEVDLNGNVWHIVRGDAW